MKDRLDKTDHKILRLLSSNAHMPFTEVAKTIGVSPATINLRMKKLNNLGVIKGATLLLDYSKIGWNMTVFLGVFLKESSQYIDVIAQLEKVPEVVKIHHTTGKYDVFIKMHANNSIHYREVYQDSILTIEGIKGVESFISVEEKLSRHIEFDS